MTWGADGLGEGRLEGKLLTPILFLERWPRIA